MDPFATAEDFRARYEEEVGDERLAALLGDASAYLLGYLLAHRPDADLEGEPMASNLRTVCCAMVHRMVGVPSGLAGVSQFSQTAGPFTESATAANPSGDMYLTAAEKALLGVPGTGYRGRLFAIRPAMGDS